MEEKKEFSFKVRREERVSKKSGNPYQVIVVTYVDELGEYNLTPIFVNDAEKRILNKVPLVR